MIALLAWVALGQDGLTLPQERGGVRAALSLRVGEQAAGPGLARCRMSVRVQGPAGLDIDGPRLEDALAAWKRGIVVSSRDDSDGVEVHVSWELIQTKPGVAPLPGITLRARVGAGPWVDFAWADLLQDVRDPPGPELTPPKVDPTWWPGFALLAAVPLALVALRLLRRRPRVVEPLARAKAILHGEGDAFVRVSRALRGFVEEVSGAPATRMTTEEIEAAFPGRIGELLRLCDGATFGGESSLSAEDVVRQGEGALDAMAGEFAEPAKAREKGKEG